MPSEHVAATMPIVIDAFAADHDDLARPDAACDQGVAVSQALVDAFAAAGVPATVVWGTDPRDVAGPGCGTGHAAVLLDVVRPPVVVDFTARQFWPDSPWPLLEHPGRWTGRFGHVRLAP